MPRAGRAWGGLDIVLMVLRMPGAGRTRGVNVALHFACCVFFSSAVPLAACLLWIRGCNFPMKWRSLGTVKKSYEALLECVLDQTKPTASFAKIMLEWFGSKESETEVAESYKAYNSAASLEQLIDQTRSHLSQLQHEREHMQQEALPGAISTVGTRILVRRVGEQQGRLMRVPDAPSHQLRFEALKVAARKRLTSPVPFARVYTAAGDELQPDDIDLIDHDDVLYFGGAAVGWKPPPGMSAENAVRLCTAACTGNLLELKRLVMEEGCDINECE